MVVPSSSGYTFKHLGVVLAKDIFYANDVLCVLHMNMRNLGYMERDLNFFVWENVLNGN